MKKRKKRKEPYMNNGIDLDKEAARQMEEAEDRAEDKRSRMLDSVIEEKRKQAKCRHLENVEIVGSAISDDVLVESGVCKDCGKQLQTKWHFLSGNKYWKAPAIRKRKYPKGFEDDMESIGDPEEWISA